MRSRFGQYLAVLTFLLLSFTNPSAWAGIPQQEGIDSNRVAPSVSFVEWTDIHLGSDKTDLGLWDKAFQQGLNDDLASFYVLCGDMVDNKDADQAAFNKRVDDFSEKYLRTMVDRCDPVILTCGNNDFYINYSTDPNNMRPTLESWKKAMGRQYYLDDLGNGVYPKHFGGLTWISMNSLIFCTKNSCDPAILKEQRQRTLAWIEKALNKVPVRSTAVIVCHVPPCIDAYDHKEMWDKDSMRTFRNILSRTSCNVVILSGHTHRNELHAIYINEAETVPVIVAGSISQKYGYKANYRRHIWEFDHQTGCPNRLSWNLYYVGEPLNDGCDTVEMPTFPQTWLDFMHSLATQNRTYYPYIHDFYSGSDDWYKLSQQSELRSKLVQEVLVTRPSNAVEVKLEAADEEVVVGK